MRNLRYCTRLALAAVPACPTIARSSSPAAAPAGISTPASPWPRPCGRSIRPCRIRLPLHHARDRPRHPRAHRLSSSSPSRSCRPSRPSPACCVLEELARDQGPGETASSANASPAAVLGLGGYAAGVAVKLAAAKRHPRRHPQPRRHPRQGQSVPDAVYASRRLLPVRADRRACLVQPTSPSSSHRLPDPAGDRALPPREEAAARLGLDRHRSDAGHYRRLARGPRPSTKPSWRPWPALKLQGWQILHLAGQGTRRSRARRPIASSTMTRPRHRLHPGDGRCLGRRRPGRQPLRRASSCAELTACGSPLDPHALSVSQGHAPAGQRQGAGRGRRGRGAGGRQGQDEEYRALSARCSSRCFTTRTNARRWRRRPARCRLATPPRWLPSG